MSRTRGRWRCGRRCRRWSEQGSCSRCSSSYKVDFRSFVWWRLIERFDRYVRSVVASTIPTTEIKMARAMPMMAKIVHVRRDLESFALEKRSAIEWKPWGICISTFSFQSRGNRSHLSEHVHSPSRERRHLISQRSCPLSPIIQREMTFGPCVCTYGWQSRFHLFQSVQFSHAHSSHLSTVRTGRYLWGMHLFLNRLERNRVCSRNAFDPSIL